MLSTGHKLFEEEFHSTEASIDEAESATGKAARMLGFGEANQRRICLAIHEAMTNAVAHGNHFSDRKRVHFEIWEATQGGLIVEIGDEGCGFDLASVPNPLEEVNLIRPSGRGLLIMRSFMDEVEIIPGGSGTCVRMAKYQPGHPPDATPLNLN